MKLRQRYIIFATLTFLGFFAILMVENEIRMMNRLSSDQDPNLYPILQRRFLNREESSKVSGERTALISESETNGVSNNQTFPSMPTTTATTTTENTKDNFSDLIKYLPANPRYKVYMRPPEYILPSYNPTLQEMLGIEARENLTNWEKFHLQISSHALYPENSDVIDNLLQDIANQKIVAVDQLTGGTQLKLVFTFEDGGKALFKPMRFPRETETLPDHFYFTDFERHHSEIATFHLDRILGFRRAPPVVGRTLNITTEIYALADDDLLKTFFVSPAGNICFHGQCTYYCDTAHAVCGHPDQLEGSLAAFLPPKSVLHRHPVRSPWRRSYHKRRKAVWEGNDSYCEQVRRTPPYDAGRRLYDIMDMAVLDFLTGNMDRHHYEELQLFGNDSAPIHWDHGRGFGRAHHDEMSILAPILQCCMIRLSTFDRLMKLHRSPKPLSELLREATSTDPVFPVLTETHLQAVDRRLAIILQVIRKCVHYNTGYYVFLDDMQRQN